METDVLTERTDGIATKGYYTEWSSQRLGQELNY